MSMLPPGSWTVYDDGSWYSEGLGGDFAKANAFDTYGSGGEESMRQAQAMYNAYAQLFGLTIPSPAEGVPPYDPTDLFNVSQPMNAPGVPTSDEQSIQAVLGAGSAARENARRMHGEQARQGQLAAGEIAAAKGRTSGTGAANIAAGIAQESQTNLDQLLAQIGGVETNALADVTNLGQGNQAALDQYAAQLFAIASGNADMYNQAYNQAGQSATDVLNQAMGIYDPYNQQLSTLYGQQQTGLADLLAQWQSAQGAGGFTLQQPFDASTYAGLPDQLAALQLPQFPSLESLQGQVQYDAPEYSPFPNIPGMESADLTPFVNQFDEFKLGDLASLSGDLNYSTEGAEGRGGRGQWNIPTYDPAAQYQDMDLWLQQLLASLSGGSGGY